MLSPLAQRTAWLVTGSLVIVAAVALFWSPWNAPDFRETLRGARFALLKGDHETALTQAASIPKQSSQWVQAQLVAGEACLRLERYEQAIVHYLQIADPNSEGGRTALFSLGEASRAAGQLTQAVEAFAQLAETSPDNPAVHERLAHLYHLGRNLSRARVHYLHQLRLNSWTLHSLAVLGDLQRPLERRAYLDECQTRAPHDALVTLGLAADEFYVESNNQTARKILERLVSTEPTNAVGQAMLGEILVTTHSPGFLSWHARLPEVTRTHPQIWFVRGLWAQSKNKPELAARCFWEVLRVHPSHRQAMFRLGQITAKLNHPGHAEIAQRAGQLFELTAELDRVLRSAGRNPEAMKQVISLLQQTGRVVEARAWAREAANRFPQRKWPQELLQAIPKSPAPLQPIADEQNLALIYSFADMPATDSLLQSAKRLDDSTTSANSPFAAIRFHQESEIGLNFTYRNADDPATSGARMFEQTGGGVAAIDFDRDDFPDLYFTQGAAWPHGDRRSRPDSRLSDQLFRNRDGEQFVNITAQSGVTALGFGQGISAGDFDNDGFPDLYIACYGQNELYRNNGDGTFTSVSHSAGLNADEWTTSCAILDLNQDGFPDLIDINYVTGPNVHDAFCNGKACSPSNFNGIADRVLINNGWGEFQSLPPFVPEEYAKGLGLLAFSLSPEQRPALFIANDQVPNFFLVSQPAENRFNLQFANHSFLSGLGHNCNGLAMACMGIAADDVNNDGLLDFFVTNFKDEANTLYLQESEGLFVDSTNAAGLTAPSLPYVGWGTEFLDADLDGWSDLIVVNGHIDDYRPEGGLYQMPAQFFRNQGQARFVEIPTRELGDYFKTPHLARSLSRLDWNRDGRMDAAISHINEPAVLLTNKTKTNGHYLTIRLQAVATSRDAIGATVTVHAGDRRWTKQIVAGDGFQTTNERALNFGLGRSREINLIEIRWPSGLVSRLRNLTADRFLNVTENGRAISFSSGESLNHSVTHSSPAAVGQASP